MLSTAHFVLTYPAKRSGYQTRDSRCRRAAKSEVSHRIARTAQHNCNCAALETHSRRPSVTSLESAAPRCFLFLLPLHPPPHSSSAPAVPRAAHPTSIAEILLCSAHGFTSIAILKLKFPSVSKCNHVCFLFPFARTSCCHGCHGRARQQTRHTTAT